MTKNVHVVWRMAVAGQAAAGYAGNPGLAAVAVAGSVGAGLADQFSDLELNCYWYCRSSFPGTLPDWVSMLLRASAWPTSTA